MRTKRGLLLAVFAVITTIAISLISLAANVFAADINYLVIDVREFNSTDDLSEKEDSSIYLLEDYDLIGTDYDEETEAITFYNTTTNKDLFTMVMNENYSWRIEVKDGLTTNDNIDFVFPDEVLEYIDDYPGLGGYTGLKMIFTDQEFQCAKVCITGVKTVDQSGRAEALSRTSFEDLKINFDLRFVDIDDFMKYEVTLLNNTDEDYEISTPNKGGEYVSYEYEFADGNTAKGKSTAKFYITVKYSNSVPTSAFSGGIYNNTDSLEINLGNNEVEPNKPSEDNGANPATWDNVIVIVIGGCVCAGLLAAAILNIAKSKKLIAVTLIVTAGVLAVPMAQVSAMIKYQVNIQSKITIPKGVKITYDKGNNDASGHMNPQSAIMGEPNYFVNNAYTMDGFTFVGWNTKSDGTGDIYFPGDEITFEEDTTLYAIWARGVYWSLNDFDRNGTNETLTFSTNVLTGNKSGSVELSLPYSSTQRVPWIAAAANSADNLSRNVTKIVIENDIMPRYLGSWFSGVGYDASSIEGDFSHLHTDYVSSFNYLFSNTGHNATSFKLTGLEGWNTSKVSSMSGLFSNSGAGQVTEMWDVGNLGGWDTSNVENMSFTFSLAGGYNCRKWYAGDLSNWNTSKVMSMNAMFQQAGSSDPNWSVGDLSGWDTSNVTNTAYMFSGAGRNATVWNVGEIKNWDMGNVTTLENMFQGAGRYSRNFVLDLSGWDTSNVTEMSGIFWTAGINAESVDVNLSGWNLPKITSLTRVFEGFGSQASESTSSPRDVKLNVSNWKTPNNKSTEYLFFTAGQHTTGNFTLDLTGWDLSSVDNIYGMFASAGRDAANWSVTIPRSNSNGLVNTTTRIYGSSSSVYTTPYGGDQQNSHRFTLAP